MIAKVGGKKSERSTVPTIPFKSHNHFIEQPQAVEVTTDHRLFSAIW